MKTFKDMRNIINEALSKADPIDKWISDFVNSDDPKFATKSKKERIEMAKGAYYGAQKEDVMQPNGLEEGHFEITYNHPQFSKPRTHTIKAKSASHAQAKFLSYGNPYKVHAVKKVQKEDVEKLHEVSPHTKIQNILKKIQDRKNIKPVSDKAYADHVKKSVAARDEYVKKEREAGRTPLYKLSNESSSHVYVSDTNAKKVLGKHDSLFKAKAHMNSLYKKNPKSKYAMHTGNLSNTLGIKEGNNDKVDVNHAANYAAQKDEGVIQPNGTDKVGSIKEVDKSTNKDLAKACWKGYTAVGTKKKNGKTVPNCVPEEVKTENVKVNPNARETETQNASDKKSKAKASYNQTVQKIKGMRMEEEYKKGFLQGAEAAKTGKKYSENPHPKDSAEHLQWAKGHNQHRANKLTNESEVDESTASKRKAMFDKEQADKKAKKTIKKESHMLGFNDFIKESSCATTKKVKETVKHPNQKALDVDGDGEIEASDLKALRDKKKSKEVEEEVKTEDAEMDESITPQLVKQGIGIAKDKRYAGGNMTGATKAMDKLHPKLQHHPKVASALKTQNEEALYNVYLENMESLNEGPAEAFSIAEMLKMYLTLGGLGALATAPMLFVLLTDPYNKRAVDRMPNNIKKKVLQKLYSTRDRWINKMPDQKDARQKLQKFNEEVEQNEDFDLDETTPVSFNKFKSMVEKYTGADRQADAKAKRESDPNYAYSDHYAKTAKSDSANKPKSTVHKGTYGSSYDGDDEKQEKKPESTEKRGRGRPSGSKSGARNKGAGVHDGGIPVHNLNLPNNRR